MRKSLLFLLFLISSIYGFTTNEIIESQILPIECATTYVQTTAMLREGLIDINAFDSYDYLQDSDGILYAANASESLEAVCLGLIEAPNEYANITIKEEIIFNGKSYNVVEIANSAFFDCTFLQNITLPATIKKIGFRAFAGCTNLESVIFPESLQIIETEAFVNCYKISSVYIPKNVTTLGDDNNKNVFLCCNNLQHIKVDKNNKHFDSRKNCNAIIETSTNSLITGCSYSKIVEGIESIGFRAFKQMADLYELNIPSTIKSINATAFDGCPNINYISVSKRNSVYDSRNNCNAIIETATNTLCIGSNKTVIPTDIVKIGACAFCGRTGLLDIVIPNSVEMIREFAFEGCFYLRSVILPQNLKEIYPAAFKNCSMLSKVIIPNSVERIWEEAFMNCTNLYSVSMPNSVIQIDDSAFRNCNNLVNSEFWLHL